ncbi:hypothetical protein [Nostoc sp. C117]|uniref:hypothetical protein n=1 Tax=Nostoc sp. C117 TaxID=3349875 RepID=UPI00370DCF10
MPNFSEKILCKHSQQDTASSRADARPAAADCVQKRRAIAEGCRKLSAMRSPLRSLNPSAHRTVIKTVFRTLETYYVPLCPGMISQLYPATT